MQRCDLNSATYSRQQVPSEVCTHSSPANQSSSARYLDLSPEVNLIDPPAAHSTWTIANSTTDSNGSSTTRGRRRFRRGKKKCQLPLQSEGRTPELQTTEMQSLIMEVTFNHKAWESCSHACSTEMCDADISSLSDFGELSDDASSNDSSVSTSTQSTKIAEWRTLMRTPRQSNVYRTKIAVLGWINCDLMCLTKYQHFGQLIQKTFYEEDLWMWESLWSSKVRLIVHPNGDLYEWLY